MYTCTHIYHVPTCIIMLMYACMLPCDKLYTWALWVNVNHVPVAGGWSQCSRQQGHQVHSSE